MPQLDLSPTALARIAPGLTLAALGGLAVPPVARAQMCRYAAGAPMLESTRVRLEAALERARNKARQGALQKRVGRRRTEEER